MAYLLKEPLANLIERLESASGKGFKFVFRRELRAAGSLATQLPLPAVEPSRDRKLRQLASLDPSAAVAAAWTDVEIAFDAVLAESQRPGATDESLSPEQRRVLRARVLTAQQLLSQNDYRVFAQLRNLRNLAVHVVREITKEEADEYILLVLCL